MKSTGIIIDNKVLDILEKTNAINETIKAL